MKRVVNWAARLLAFCLLLVLGAGGLAYTWLKTTVPALSGTLAITGLTSSVEIVRDNEGVPHIFAATVDDAFCALGYVHAQDRLWQMELARRAGQGRLSEIFGQSTFERDVLLRTLDLYGHAERSLSPSLRSCEARSMPMHAGSMLSSGGLPTYLRLAFLPSSSCSGIARSRGVPPTAWSS